MEGFFVKNVGDPSSTHSTSYKEKCSYIHGHKTKMLTAMRPHSNDYAELGPQINCGALWSLPSIPVHSDQK